MVLSSDKKDPWTYVTAALFSPIVMTIMMVILSAPLILLSIVLGYALALVVWANGLMITGGVVWLRHVSKLKGDALEVKKEARQAIDRGST
jgi:hypothetical protein